MKKRWIILIILVLLIGVGWYNFFVPHGGARKRLAEYKKELIAKGEKLDIVAFAPKPKAGVTNVATEFLALGGRWGAPVSTDFPYAMRVISPGIAATGTTNIDTALMANYPANKIVAAQLRELFRGTIIEFNVDYSQGSEVLLPHLAPVKRIALQLSDTAREALHADDLAEAALDLGAAADLFRIWDHEPILIASLVRTAIARFAINVAWEALQHDGWTDAQLAMIQSKWEVVDFFGPTDRIMAFERAFCIDGMARARKAKSLQNVSLITLTTNTYNFSAWFSDFKESPRESFKQLYEHYPKFWMWKSVWSYDEEYCTLQIATIAQEACREITTRGFCAPSLAELLNQTSNCVSGHPFADKYLLSSGTEGVYHRSLLKAARTESARRLVVAAVALKRFYLRHGKWPQTLDELVPDFLSKVPVDFMDGKPLRYKAAAEGRFLLYSVGEDGKDDDGDPTPLPGESLTRLEWLAGRDIVWPQPATEQQIKDFLDREAKRTNAPPVEK